MQTLTFAELATTYCHRQDSTPQQLLLLLQAQRKDMQPEGWMLLECVDMSSSWLGSLTVLGYGPNNTYKTVPDRPISPRGLASDMSTVKGVLPAADLPDVLPDVLKDWSPPPPPAKSRRRTRQ